MQRFVRLGWVLACSACVGKNPDWDGAAEGTSSTRGATSSSDADEGTAATAGDGTVDGGSSNAASTEATPADTSAAESDSDSESASTTGAADCESAPPPVGFCPFQCENNCFGGVCSFDELYSFPGRSPIMCPEGWPCHVVCSGTQACKQRIIRCPSAHACTIECTGEQACQQSTIECGDGPCDLSCVGDEQTCDQLELVCGAGDGLVTCDTEHDAPPMLEPAAASACACESVGC